MGRLLGLSKTAAIAILIVVIVAAAAALLSVLDPVKASAE